MKRPVVFLILLLSMICTAVVPSSAEKDPRPNNSETTALLFGDIGSPLPANTTPAPDWQPGTEKCFSVLNVETGIIGNMTGRVFLVTDHFVFWCDTEELYLFPEELSDTLISFDAEVFPLLRRTFGEENNPGVDNDPRIHVIFTGKIGTGYNGYFSSEDTADPRIRPSSNGMEMVFLSTSLFTQGSGSTGNTLAHELQHLIHFYHDPNEMSFINEGLSGLAEYLAVGKTREVFIRNYLSDTGKSLIWWPESGVKTPYYGSSFLFSMYLYDRFGEDFIRTLVQMSGNGLTGIDQALLAEGIGLTADDIFARWAAALLGQLTENPVQDWDYTTYRFPQNGIYRDITNLNCGISVMYEVPQYGLRFFRSSCPGDFRIQIEANAESPVTSLQIPAGNHAWWGGAVSNSAAILSRNFDLTSVSAPITFDYDAAFDLEMGYDYYYLLLKDGSGHVERLYPSTFSAQNPAGLNLGGGTSGRSDGTVHESIDLSPWAGQRIRITFVYLTDTAGLGDGLLLDNFRIDAIGFSDGTEETDNGWEAEGFSRIRASTPQNYLLTVLFPQSDGTSRAAFFTFNGEEPFALDCPEGCVFGISAVNRDVRSRASFTVLVTTPD